MVLLVSADFLSSDYCYDIELNEGAGTTSQWPLPHRPGYSEGR